jgi:hypothetical protein
MDFQLPILVHLRVFLLGSWHMCEVKFVTSSITMYKTLCTLHLKGNLKLCNGMNVCDIFLNILVTNFQGGVMNNKLCEDDSS